jgi:multidrug efflux pump
VSSAAADVSFPRMMELQSKAAHAILADPDVESVASFIGSDGTNATNNSGRFTITLKPRNQRAGADEIIARISNEVQKVEGITLFMQSVQDLQIDNRVSQTQYQYTLEDADSKELAQWAPQVVAKLKTLPQLKDVASDAQNSGLQMVVTIDRDTAMRMGISPQTIDDTLYDSFGQRQISTIFTQLNLYRVILEVKPEFQKDPNALNQIYVKSQTGDQVPLSAFCHFKEKVAPLAVSHQGQFPAVTISFNTGKGASLGEAMKAIAQAEAELGMPPSIHADFEGTAQAFTEALGSEPILVLAALITVYIVLGVLYESYIHPITIISTLPSAGVGAFLALMVCGSEFSVIALIGIILLIGIVKKNAIMMIDFALEAERDHGMSPQEAIHQACLLRFRPIMMTTLAALLGGLPLALGTGTGSELRRPLGISIVGGLIFSQVLTLYTTPVIYLYMEKLSRWLAGKAPATSIAPVPRGAA